METRYHLALPISGMNTEARIDSFTAAPQIKPSSYSFHLHTAFEVYFLEEGSLEVCVEGEQIHLKKRDILILFPQTMHRVVSCTDNIRKFNLRFLFRQSLPLEKNLRYQLFQTEPWRRDEIFQNIACISRQLEENQTPPDSFRIKAYLGIVLSDLMASVIPRKREEKQDMSGEERQNKLDLSMEIDSFFEEHYGERITISSLAERLHYSPTHINRLLRSFWGMTFGEKLMKTRLHEAKNLLRSTHLSIGEIAEKCGYSTLRGFELFFSKETGLLPGQYRALFSDGENNQ